MKRNLVFRLFMGTLIILFGLIALSYTHSRASRQDDPAAANEGKCDSKCQSPFVLWESLTHNLLISKH
ncbi:MAG TPA: hypothetical protein VMH27_18270 [Puia sp.]|nr:hypothetical protein [Puia sp.]